MKKYIVLIGMLTAVALSGCTSQAVAEVKALALPGSATLTVGQALDHRKVCKDVAWKELTSEQGQKVVEYTCSLDGVVASSSDENPVLSKVETMQWTVGPSGQPVLSYLGWTLTRKNGKVSTVDASRNSRPQFLLDATFSVIAANRVTGNADYSKAINEAYNSEFYGAVLDGIRARGSY